MRGIGRGEHLGRVRSGPLIGLGRPCWHRWGWQFSFNSLVGFLRLGVRYPLFVSSAAYAVLGGGLAIIVRSRGADVMSSCGEGKGTASWRHSWWSIPVVVGAFRVPPTAVGGRSLTSCVGSHIELGEEVCVGVLRELQHVGLVLF